MMTTLYAVKNICPGTQKDRFVKHLAVISGAWKVYL